VAIFSALLSALIRRIGTLVQALFGWSVTALFGRLPKMKQLAVSVTLLLALVWPLLVAGIFFPQVASWALAFLPLHDWLDDTVLRLVWGALALVVPPCVGLITRYVADARSLRGGVLRTTLAGYPVTIGYCLALLITVVTVPLVKLAATARRWSDDHVYVQSRPGEYNKAIHSVAEAFALAGLVPQMEPIPTHLSLATELLKWFARSALGPILPERPQRVHAQGVEAFLYPSDLLLRGEAQLVGRVRAMLTRTELERYAYLVSEPAAQKIQDELARVWDALRRHEHPQDARKVVELRLGEIYREMNRLRIPFDDWALLERQARRLERAAYGGPNLLDRESDDLETTKAAAHKLEAESIAKESLRHGIA